MNVFYSQDYTNTDSDNYEANVTTASARTSAGVISTNATDKPQINFEVVCDTGYEVEEINVTPSSNYNALKGSSETGVEGIYRITKVTGDITVTITTKEISSESTTGSEITTDADATTEASETTTDTGTTTDEATLNKVNVGRTKVKKATKKLTSKKIKTRLTKIKGTVKSKKIKNKKKL